MTDQLGEAPMHHRGGRQSLLLTLALGTFACRDATGPVTTLAIPGAPDFAAKVVSNTHKEFFAPSGYWVSQYEVWVAIPPTEIPNAGVVVAAARPVFVSANGVLRHATPDDIAPGDSIEIWHDATVAYGSAQAPPGAPAYRATQVVVVRSAS